MTDETDDNDFADLGSEQPRSTAEFRADARKKREEVDRLINALNRPGKHQKVFQFGGGASVITREASTVLRRVNTWAGADVIIRSIPRRANPGLLQGPVDDISTWVKFYRTPAPGEDREVAAPEWVFKMICDIYGEGLRPLAGIADFPVIGADGKLLTGRGGYDPLTRLYVDCGPVDWEIHEFTDPREAYAFLRNEWLGEFNFASEADAARALAIPLTILNRRTRITNGSPIPFVTAPTPETGKTILCQVLVEVVTNTPLAATSWDHDSEQERRKMILSLGIENPAAVLFDNINNGWEVRDPTVERWCTSDRISDRLLGKNENASVPSTALLMFTGNNITAGSTDLQSRSYEVRMERPARGKTFKRSDIMSWTTKNRPKIFAALMCLINADQRKTRHYRPASRFPVWAELVGEKVQYAANDKTLFTKWEGTGYEGVNDDLQHLIDAMCAPAFAKKDSFTPQEMSDHFSVQMAHLEKHLTKEFMWDRHMVIDHAKVPPKMVHKILRKYNGHMVENKRFRISIGEHPTRAGRKVNLFSAVDE